MTGTDLAATLADNAPQLEERRALDDRLEHPRPVDHTAVFRKKRSAAAAAVELEAMGYQVTVSGGLLRTTVDASKVERLDGDEPDRFVTEVFAVIERHGGVYDGWGAPVVRAD